MSFALCSWCRGVALWRWCWLLVIGLLGGCATPLATRDAEALLLDHAFAAPDEVPDARRIFALSPAMQAYLDREIAASTRRRGNLQGLVEALYSRQQLRLEYDAVRTRTAAEAFEARAGNCLSLVIMTSAFAQALRVPMQYQRVMVEDHWRMAGGLMQSTGHVNLGLGSRAMDERGGLQTHRAMTIDFLEPEVYERQRILVIDEATIVGMYMNNRAVESLSEGRYDQAYWWAREAVRQAPWELAGYNTLALVYQRRGLVEAAERVYRTAIARDPDNVRLLANLVPLLQQQGRLAESQPLAQRLRALEPVPPFRDYWLGITALREGRYDAALLLFERELARSPSLPEPHLGLARVYLARGALDRARQHLAQARDLSSSRGERALYSAKLEGLPAHRNP